MPYHQQPLTPLVLCPDDVAQLLGCSSWTVRRLIRSGQLPAIRLGRRYLIRVSDLHAFLEQATNHNSSPPSSSP